jgi:two-component system, sensor histidine kinase and response regulator
MINDTTIPMPVDEKAVDQVTQRSDALMNYFLASFFIAGLILAFFYDTWLIAIGVGSLLLFIYYFVKMSLPGSVLYQYVLSLVMAMFMAQYIYQMHGMFEMHFVAFIASALLITYQNWKLQIPLVIFVIVHHATLGYLQNMGVDSVYFTQLNGLDLQTFIIHIFLSVVVFFICGLWAFQLKKYNRIQLEQTREMARLEREALIHKQRIANEEILKFAYEKAEKARKEADDANKAKSIFLATMSHEIRTPMNGVIGMAALLNETQLTIEQQEYTKTITSCGEALLNVINDILDFSKIESGNMELDESDFHLRSCIEDVLDVFAGKAGVLGIDLVYQIDPALPEQLIGDSLRLRQVLMNLVNNAIKFTEKGEIYIGIKQIATNMPGKITLEFTVRDTGIGIPADKAERLFKAFSQVDSSTTRRYGGTGLGLIICDKLIALMGGRIWVQSEVKKGSVFTFTINCEVSALPNKKPLTDHIDLLNDKHVLVVDDNATNRAILKAQLEHWQMKPVIAVSAKQALDILEKYTHFDLVLTDMQMPDMDGCQLAGHIKQLQPSLPVILLSSIGEERNKKCDILFSAVLTKPVKQDMLYKSMINELRDKEKTTHLAEPSRQRLSADFAQMHPLKILVAEDNLVNQNLTLKVLEKLGYQAALANNGVEVTEMVNLQQYDLILMDIQMPEMDGLEATQMIRKYLEEQPVIIAMTVNAMKEDREDCMKAGMDDFLSKPVRLDEMINTLIKWSAIIKENKLV